MSSEARTNAVAVVRRLRAAGFEALLAGGCVRDELLGRTPKDYDVATNAPADRVQTLFTGSLPVGAQFGVVLVPSGEDRIEVATFRRDGVYVDSRHPVTVTFGNAEEDAARRDFTINGMFLDPIDDRVIVARVSLESPCSVRMIDALNKRSRTARFLSDACAGC